MTNSAAEQIKTFCARIGEDPLLVQGAGGNASWKQNGTLWVKASGTWLASASDCEIFVPVDLTHLQQEIARHNFSVVPQVIGDTQLRPSIETMLHALMPHNVVVHIHAVEVLAHLVREVPLEQLEVLIGNFVNWVFVDYFKPGAELAQAVSEQLLAHPDTDVIFLRNHGVVIGATDTQSIELILYKLLARLKNKKYESLSTGKCSTRGPLPLIDGYAPCSDKEMHLLATHKELSSRLAREWALYPDHVVFLGEHAAIVENALDLSALTNIPAKSTFVFITGLGVLESTSATEAHKAQLRCYYDVMVRQSPSQKLRTLSRAEVGALLNWEAEKYRSNLSCESKE